MNRKFIHPPIGDSSLKLPESFWLLGFSSKLRSQKIPKKNKNIIFRSFPILIWNQERTEDDAVDVLLFDVLLKWLPLPFFWVIQDAV